MMVAFFAVPQYTFIVAYHNEAGESNLNFDSCFVKLSKEFFLPIPQMRFLEIS